jgi:hypothetical protein
MSAATQLLGHIKDFASQGSDRRMLQDLIRLTVERIMRDKILLGLVIIGLFGIFVGGFSPGREEHPAPRAVDSQAPSAAPEKAAPQTQSAYTAVGALEPGLACDFARWWINGALDYSRSSAAQSHTIAFRWMTPDARRSLENSLWTPALASGIAQGTIIGAFQPISVQAEALNPDGSVVVGISGTLVLQSTGRPITQAIAADVLVRKEPSGLRVAGLYNRSAPPVTNASY